MDTSCSATASAAVPMLCHCSLFTSAGFTQLQRYATACSEMWLLSIETCFFYSFYCFKFYFLLMMDIAKFETFKNFTILNKTLLFAIKLHKTAVQSVSKIFIEFIEISVKFMAWQRPYFLNWILTFSCFCKIKQSASTFILLYYTFKPSLFCHS